MGFIEATRENHTQADALTAGPEWLHAQRSQGWSELARRGLPNRRQEAWRNTDLSRVERQAFAAAPPPTAAEVDALRDALPTLPEAAAELVFIDGHFVVSLSRVGALPAGAYIGTLVDAPASVHDVFAPLQGETLDDDAPDGATAALSAASAADTAAIVVPRDCAIEGFIHLVHVARAHPHAVVHAPRIWVALGENATMRLVETGAAASDVTLNAGAAQLQARAARYVLSQGADLDVTRLHGESERALVLGSTRAALQSRSRLALRSVVAGAALSRDDVQILLDGSEGSVALDALMIGGGEREVEVCSLIDHATPSCTSRQRSRAIVGDHARARFDGRVLFRVGAQKSDTAQESRSLLLSEDAEAFSKPQLEIFADDVKASHGSTVGQIDEDSLFYLRARGVPAAQARRMLTEAFAVELLADIVDETVAAQAAAVVRRAVEALFVDGGDS
jgi:Fe-S cluster assembly protein SufD